MASFSTMAEQQPEEKTEQKPLSHPEKYAENLDDVLAARTIEELLKKPVKKLPQEDKQAGDSSQSGTQLKSNMFSLP